MHPADTHSRPLASFWSPARSTSSAWLLGAMLIATQAGVARAEGDLAAQFEAARQAFRPVTAEQVASARADLQKQMTEVENFVKPDSENGQQWMRFLRWDGLKASVAADQDVNLEALDNTLGQLGRNLKGLEHQRFRGLSHALRHFRDTAAVASWKNPAELYGKQLDALQQAVASYQQEPSDKNAAALSQRLHVVDSIGQSPELLGAVRKQVSLPNAFVAVSTSYVAAGVDPVDRQEPVHDCILGVSVESDSHTTGTVTVASVPAEDKAVLEFSAAGHVDSDSEGRKGPALILSTSDTEYTAKKRVEFADAAFLSHPADAEATTDTHIHSVSKEGGGFGSRFVSRIGWSRACESEHEAEAIAADHAEDRIENKFNDEVMEKLSEARGTYEHQFREPLERRDAVPEPIRFSSTADALKVEMTQARRAELAAPAAPPEVTQTHDVTMRLHQSAVNNYTAAMLAGATARQTSADEDIHFDVELPSWIKRLWEDRKTAPTEDAAAKEEPFKAFAMTLADPKPISVEFLGGSTLKLTLHIAHMQSGENQFDAWNVTGTYKHQMADGRVVLTRQGKLEMLPADFDGKLSAEQVAQRSNLEKEFNKRSAQGHGFPQTIELDPTTPKGQLADAGPLGYREFATDGGWLVIGLDRQAETNVLPPPQN